MLRAYLPLYVMDQFGDEYVTIPVIKEDRLFAQFDDGTLLPVMKPEEVLRQIRTDPEGTKHQLLITKSEWEDTDELKFERWRFLLWKHQPLLIGIGLIILIAFMFAFLIQHSSFRSF